MSSAFSINFNFITVVSSAKEQTVISKNDSLVYWMFAIIMLKREVEDNLMIELNANIFLLNSTVSIYVPLSLKYRSSSSLRFSVNKGIFSFRLLISQFSSTDSHHLFLYYIFV